MMWDHAEVNPFVKGSGSLIGIKDNILKGLKYSTDKLLDRGNVEITQGSISGLKQNVEIVVTDPPYYDDVQYIRRGWVNRNRVKMKHEWIFLTLPTLKKR